MENIFSIFPLVVLKQTVRGIRLVLTVMLTGLLLLLASGPADAAADDVAVFSGQSNSLERVRMLKNLTETRQPVGVEKARTLIHLGLADKAPNVVEAAVLQIGRMKSTGFEDQLIQVFNGAQKAHPGYGERVRLACLSSLGKIGGANTARLLSDALAKDQGTVEGGVLLKAVRELKDPTLIRDLEAYTDKMTAQIEKGKTAKDNPLLYSMALQHLAYAEKTIEMLRRLEGGAK